MKNLVILTLTLSLLFFVSFASAEEVFQIVETEDVVLAGTVPGDLFYNAEMLIERFTEMFGENIKLAHAQERIAEAKLMIAEGKINESQVAMKNFDKVFSRIKNQSRMREHKQLRENLGSRISLIASKGNMTDSDRQAIKLLIFEHKEKIMSENVEIIAGNKNINQAKALELYEQERTKVQQRVTTKISNRVMGANN